MKRDHNISVESPFDPWAGWDGIGEALAREGFHPRERDQQPQQFIPPAAPSAAIENGAVVTPNAAQFSGSRGNPGLGPTEPGQSPAHPQAGGGSDLSTGPGISGSLPLSSSRIEQFEYREVVVDKNGRPRHAGSDSQEGEFIRRFKESAERNLYVFCKGVLNRHFLTTNLHRPVCEFLQKVPPYRKLVLMPREHAKTAIVSGGLPLHIIIQPAEGNIYFPGLAGRECRIMLAGENMRMAKKNLRVLEGEHTNNRVLRALWPECVWDEPRRQSKVWSQEALIFPRETEWPDPTIWAIGVDGAVTGSRPNVMIKDDLISIEAANSDVVMESAIEWHIASRALLDTYEKESGLQSLEFIIGTRWAVFDLYSYIMDNDPSVEVIDEAFHSIIRDGKILWPEKHTEASIQQLRLEHGSNFYLLYLNSVADPALVDFDLEMVREYRLVGEGQDAKIVFDEDERDEELAKRAEMSGREVMAPRDVAPGTVMNGDFLRDRVARREWFRARYG